MKASIPVFSIAEKSLARCTQCGICDEIVACSSLYAGYAEDCVGCGACYLACPNEAIEMKDREEGNQIRIRVDDKNFSVPEKVTVKKALELLGYRVFAPCEVGGCYSCAVEIRGETRPSCVTGVKEGMEVKTEFSGDRTPRRLVHGWMGHSVGGVGTPWHLKRVYGYVEAAAFACGCNLRCPQCQNWTTTYCGKEVALTPREAAVLMSDARRRSRVDRMAISGGECTLNRSWLVEYIHELRRLNHDEKARFHIDTNATILTSDYIDELIESGMTDIGPDLKGFYLETFMRITGLKDKDLATEYHKTSWEAVRYLIDRYKNRIFIGIGIPYNRDLISLEEIARTGEEIFKIDPEVQVCALDYRPEFRRKNISRPGYEEMVRVWKALKATGLRTVICQTERGHIGPDEQTNLYA